MTIRDFLRAPLLVLFAAALTSPRALGQTHVLVSSDFNDSVQRYSETGEHLGAFVPSGFGGLDAPQGITVGPDGNVYVSSGNTDQVLRYRGTDGAFMGAFVDAGGLLDQPWYLTFGPDQNLYVSSSLTSQVLCYDQNGTFVRVAAQHATLTRPDGISFLPNGQMLVSNFAGSNAKIIRFNPNTGSRLNTPVSDTRLLSPLEHRVLADGTTLLVSGFGNNTIRKYSLSTGVYLGDFATEQISGPVGQLVMPDGSVLISSWISSTINRYDGVSGAFLSTFTALDGLDHPNNMTLLTIPEPVTTASIFGVAYALFVGSLRRRQPLLRIAAGH